MTSFNAGYYYPSSYSSAYSGSNYGQSNYYDDYSDYSMNYNPYYQETPSIWDYLNQFMQSPMSNYGGGYNVSGNSFNNSSSAQSVNGDAYSQSNQYNIFAPIINIFMPPQQQQQQPPVQPEPTPQPQPQPEPEKPQQEEKKGIDWGAIGGAILGGLAVAGIVALCIDPLSVDLNGDGKVSGEAGKGVDLDGDGKADGAATNGDGMLAMGDLNGNGKVDGSEVFGDKTIDPFTGQAVDAKNGYEALQKVAKSAQEHTGMNVMDQDGNVDLFKLRESIQQGTNGKGSLGFIGGDNVTNIQSLESANIQSINTNYKEQAYDKNSDVQHRQAAQATTRDGQQRKSEDLWFKKTA